MNISPSHSPSPGYPTLAALAVAAALALPSCSFDCQVCEGSGLLIRTESGYAPFDPEDAAPSDTPNAVSCMTCNGTGIQCTAGAIIPLEHLDLPLENQRTPGKKPTRKH